MYSFPDLSRRRQLNFIGFAACVGLMAYALYAQYQLDLAPCPLCVFQRIAVIAMGCIFLAAGLHNPGYSGARVYGVLLVLAAGMGITVAGRHLWLQNLPPDQVPACGPGLDFMMDSFPLAEVLQMVFTGSGECADIAWSFLGLSMPAWVLIAVSGLGIYAVVTNLTAIVGRKTKG
jgi:disulfide bond formation protein DsbB